MSAFIGFLTGAAASMGLGGGFILIIYLTIFANVDQMTAQGINLVFFLPIALLSIIIHSKNKLIEWKAIPWLCGAGLAGVVAGSWLSGIVGGDFLQKMFAVLLVIVGIKETFHKKQKNTIDK